MKLIPDRWGAENILKNSNLYLNSSNSHYSFLNVRAKTILTNLFANYSFIYRLSRIYAHFYLILTVLLAPYTWNTFYQASFIRQNLTEKGYFCILKKEHSIRFPNYMWRRALFWNKFERIRTKKTPKMRILCCNKLDLLKFKWMEMLDK